MIRFAAILRCHGRNAGASTFTQITRIQVARSIHHNGPALLWFPSRGKSKQQKEIKFTVDESKIDAASSLDDAVVALKHTYRDNTITLVSKRHKLKRLLLMIIDKSPDNFILGEHLKYFDDALQLLIQANELNEEEAIKILKASIRNLDLHQVPDLNFIPQLYSQLSNSQTLHRDSNRRLEILEIFINYILLSNKRYQFSRVVDSYTQAYPNQVNDVVIMSLDALSHSQPDAKSVLKLADVYDFNNSKQNMALADLFIQACDLELEHGYRTEIEQNCSTFIETIAQKGAPLQGMYLKLAQFASKNKFDAIAESLLLEKFSDLTQLSTDEAHELLFLAMKYGNPRKLCDLVVSLPALKDVPSFQVYWKLFTSATEFDPSLMASDAGLEYNDLIKICLYSGKSKEFINSLDEFCEEELGAAKDLETYSTLIDHSLDIGEVQDAVQIFELSLADDFIDWQDNLPLLFRMFAKFVDAKESQDLPRCHELYTKIKNFKDSNLDQMALACYFERLIDELYIGDALTLLEKEIPASTREHPRVYTKLRDFVLTYNDDYGVNMECFDKLDKFFQIEYDDYYPILDKFCQLQRPKSAYKIFTVFRNHAKDVGSQLLPPNERHYTLLFNKFAELQFEEGVNKLHLLMKIDLNIVPDVDLLNAVLESFTNVQELLKVRDVYDTIRALPQDRGLNSRTVSIMLKCHTFMTVPHLRNFWNNLSELDYFPTRPNYKQYLLGHCYHDCFDEALILLDQFAHDGELQVDQEILSTLYNYTPSSEGRTRIEEYSKAEYPAVWSKVQSEGLLVEKDAEMPALEYSGRDELLLLT